MQVDQRGECLTLPAVTAILTATPADAHHTHPTSAVPSLTGLALALGAMGLATAAQTITILLLRFLTDNVAISAAAASAVIALAHFYDATVDPVIGHASDRTRTRRGRRQPYMLCGTLLLPLSVVLLFNIPNSLTSGMVIAYVMVLLFVQATSGSIYKVPYMATAIELSAGYHERSRLMAFRVGGHSLGLMLGSTIPSWTLVHWGTQRSSYADMAWLIGAVVFVCCLLGMLLLPKERAITAPAPRLSLREYARLAWDNKPFRIICASHGCFMIGVATVGSSNAYFTHHVLNASDGWLGMFYVIMVLASLVSIPLWLWASKRFDKKPTYMCTLGIYSVLHLTWLWSDATESLEIRCLRVLLIGIALGGVMLLAFSIIADVIRYDGIRTGLRREGALSGIQSIVDRAFGVLGIVAMGLLLTVFDYVISDDTTVNLQPDTAITAIYICFSILPALTGFLSMLILSRYRMTAEMMDERSAAEDVNPNLGTGRGEA